MLGEACFCLAFVDQHVQAQLLARLRGEVARKPRRFGVDIVPHAQQLGKVAGQRIGLGAHFRNHGAEHDRGAHGLQRVFRLDQKRRRWLAADPLQRCKNFNDHGAPFVERRPELLFALVERPQTRLRGVDACFDVADMSGGIDELLIERGAVGANCLDLLLELALALQATPFVACAPHQAPGHAA